MLADTYLLYVHVHSGYGLSVYMQNISICSQISVQFGVKLGNGESRNKWLVFRCESRIGQTVKQDMNNTNVQSEVKGTCGQKCPKISVIIQTNNPVWVILLPVILTFSSKLVWLTREFVYNLSECSYFLPHLVFSSVSSRPKIPIFNMVSRMLS